MATTDAAAAEAHNAEVMARFGAQMREMVALEPGDPAAARIVRDIEFARPDGHPLLLDLYLPERPAAPAPVVVSLHGGGWRAGDRTQVPPVTEAFAARGLAIASVEYRLSDQATFPAQLDDVRLAVRWLRTHGAEHGLDVTSVGLWGSSAGGHLAALAATSARNGVDRVQAVVDGYGPTTLQRMDEQRGPGDMIHGAADSPESLLFGMALAHVPADGLAAADPVAHVTAGAPPFLIVHGDADILVPPGQSIALHEALVAAGAQSALCLIEGGYHGLLHGHTLSQTPAPEAEIRTRTGTWRGPVSFALIERFFDRHLRRDPWCAP
jgi:acetyl esterase/lipase